MAIFVSYKQLNSVEPINEETTARAYVDEETALPI